MVRRKTHQEYATFFIRSYTTFELNSLDGSGNRQRGFVYAAGRVMAEQTQYGTVFVHPDPSGVSTRHTSGQAGNTSAGFDELDPLGAEVYADDPYLNDPGFSGRGEGGPVYPGYGNVTQPSTGCMIDGVYTLCDFIDRLYNSEGTEYRYTVAEQKVTKAGPGFVLVVGFTTFIVPRVYQGLGLVMTADAIEERRGEFVTYWDPKLVLEVVPQNTGFDIPGIKNLVGSVLAQPDCNEFARTVLSGVSSKNNPVYPANGGLADVLSAFLAQGGLFIRGTPGG